MESPTGGSPSLAHKKRKQKRIGALRDEEAPRFFAAAARSLHPLRPTTLRLVCEDQSRRRHRVAKRQFALDAPRSSLPERHLLEERQRRFLLGMSLSARWLRQIMQRYFFSYSLIILIGIQHQKTDL
jgi:hypothetical protein